MSTAWFYADRQRQQRGPVDAAQLIELVRAGEVNTASLVWREGLPQWVPLSRVALEVGLVPAPRPAAPGAPPPPRHAERPAAPRPAPRVPTVQPGKSTGVPSWVIVLIVLVALVPIVGVIAAIALPAYHDYTQRAKVAGEIARVSPLKVNVAEFRLTEDRCPENGEGGIADASSYRSAMIREVEVGGSADGTCIIEMRFDAGGGFTIDDRIQLHFDPATTQWTTHASIDQRLLPPSMRRPGG